MRLRRHAKEESAAEQATEEVVDTSAEQVGPLPPDDLLAGLGWTATEAGSGPLPPEAEPPVAIPTLPEPSTKLRALRPPTRREVEAVAMACHEAARIHALSLGDEHEPWDKTGERAREFGREAASLALGGFTAQEFHQNRVARRAVNGWKLGPTEDSERLESPNMVPYEELPPTHKTNLELFFAVAVAMGRALGIIEYAAP